MYADELKICSYSKKCEQLLKSLGLKSDEQIRKWQILNCRNIQNLIISFINFTPRTKKELKEAIQLWYYNKNEAIAKYGDINTWNVSNITDMSFLFTCCMDFNDNINNWDVSNVTYMNYMFFGCKKFNQPLNNWDVSNVQNMTDMFNECEEFNQQLNNWDVSNVRDMRYMFFNVQNMNGMFFNSKKTKGFESSIYKSGKTIFTIIGVFTLLYLFLKK